MSTASNRAHGPSSRGILIMPRVLRLRDAPRYLGMNRNLFNSDVRPFLTEVHIGRQGVAFDRLELDEGHTLRAGLSKMHGLRHAYAHQRYDELTGWKSPAAGGPSSKSLTREQRDQDHHARLTISRELGHERKEIVSVYLGT